MPININGKINNLQIRVRALLDSDPLKTDDTGEGRWMTILVSFFVMFVGAIFVHYLMFVNLERNINVTSGKNESQVVSLNTLGLKKINEQYKNRATDYERSLTSPDQFVDPSR